MIIPVKCFTCGKVLANKYRYYEREVRKRNMANSANVDEVVYLTEQNKDKTPSGEVLDILKLKPRPINGKVFMERSAELERGYQYRAPS